jgi:hypothetical protein
MLIHHIESEPGRIELKAPLTTREFLVFRDWFKFFFSEFKPTFPTRKIHNIYFDTIDLKLLEASREGEFKRGKVRLRTYNQDQNSQLEFKVKDGTIVKKIIFPVPSSNSNFQKVQSEIVKQAADHGLLEMMEATHPVLINSYDRQYFENQNGIRMTIDRNVLFRPSNEFASVGSELNFTQSTEAIVEWKFAPDLTDTFNRLYRQKFPFKISKFSKYVHGMEQLGW